MRTRPYFAGHWYRSMYLSHRDMARGVVIESRRERRAKVFARRRSRAQCRDFHINRLLIRAGFDIG